MTERDNFGCGGWPGDIQRKVAQEDVESVATAKKKTNIKCVFGLMNPSAITNRMEKSKRSFKKIK